MGELEVWPSTASSVLMVHSSTRTTSSVTGGSTLTAPLPRISTLSMMKLLLSVKLLRELLLMGVLVPMKHQLTMLLLQLLRATTLWREDEAEELEAAGITGEGEGVKEEEVELKKAKQAIERFLNMLPKTFSIIYFVFIYTPVYIVFMLYKCQ